ncbi:MAG: hypothetical protein BJ554DRAFT_110 [Olpidium bornovanus]|uniref:Uncharacterized protein n=1 Tax=Olpidium bornovanus TaxID=278681 RepID=A0A8H7ZUM9_9FUNG|nr:MAG: hypothetical protein BJ554DRAFT_110 [Olpidium bornovanus]
MLSASHASHLAIQRSSPRHPRHTFRFLLSCSLWAESNSTVELDFFT